MFKKSLYSQIVDAYGNGRIDFLELLYTSIKSSEKAFLVTLQEFGINTDIILKHCQYIFSHPSISKIGIFAFLELLTKLLDKLPLDVNDVDLMNIELMQHLPIDMNDGKDQDTLDRDENKSDVSTDKKKDKKKKLTVEYFGTDLCKEFRDGSMDPIIGREKEIDQMVYTLLRKTKNNPLLIGEAGVGKTAVVE
jgi:ATP-dependent Clp protease ATP-binding subunit ClpB